MQTIDLRSILNLYVDWFNRVDPFGGRVPAKPATASTYLLERDAPDITQVADAARAFLADALTEDFPVPFALSLIESVAYTTSRFASADRANGVLYRAAALQILEAGLPLQAESRAE
jgi:hypothetical protein